MNTHDTAEKLLQNTTGRVIGALAVLATPIIIGLVWYFGMAWLDNRFDAINKNQAALAIHVDNVQAAIDRNTENDRLTHDRLIIAEQAIQAAREDRDRFQAQALDSLAQLQSLTGKMSESLAAANATLQQMQLQTGERRR